MYQKSDKFVFWLNFITILTSYAIIACTVFDYIKYLSEAHETLLQLSVHWILKLGRICG